MHKSVSVDSDVGKIHLKQMMRMMMIIMLTPIMVLFPPLEACDRMVTGLHLTSYLAPGARATAAGVHAVVAYGVLEKQQSREMRKHKRSNAALTDVFHYLNGSINFSLINNFINYFKLHTYYY